jgi:hypothetical protein
MIWGSIVTIPGRPIAAVLPTIRPLVDKLSVYVVGTEVPECVAKLADEIVVDPVDKMLCHAKLWHVKMAREQGANLYLSFDDDLLYPADYSDVMKQHVEYWGGRALVTLLTRRYEGHVTEWLKWKERTYWNTYTPTGVWANYPGTVTLAFNPQMHPTFPHDTPGVSDVNIAEWAQKSFVPIWNPPHHKGWLKYILPEEADTLWKRFTEDKFTKQNAWISQIPEWYTFHLEK